MVTRMVGRAGSTSRLFHSIAVPGSSRCARFSTSSHLDAFRSVPSSTRRASPPLSHSPAAAAAAASTLHQIRRKSSSTNTRGSYHSPISANATLLSDIPSISPRSLVKYLDSYVVGQTRAKKVLAVGVWNHYLRVASNQRMKDEAESRIQQHEQDHGTTSESTTGAQEVDGEREGLSESALRSLRLGKVKTTRDIAIATEEEAASAIKDSWQSQQRIQQERQAERERDPHGEATRSLMFGRSEREWLVNAGGPSALIDDPPHTPANVNIVHKFGDDPSRTGGKIAKRVPAKTPAEEASSQLEHRKWSSSGQESALAEVASRMHDAVLSDYTPERSGSAEEGGAAKIGVFGADEPLYFSSNTVRGLQGAGEVEAGKAARGVRSQGGADGDAERKRESPQERAAYAEERIKRALKLARERLSATTPSIDDVQPAPHPSNPPSPPSTPTTTQQPASSPSLGLNPSFLSAQPGTLPFFEKSNILLLGPSGSGKTLLLRTLAQALDVPFVHIDATPLTMAGYVGEDVESIIQRLLVAAGWDVERAQRGIVCIDEIDKLRKSGVKGGGGGKDVGGEGVQQALLRMLEGTVVEVANKGGGGGGEGKAVKTPVSGQQREDGSEGDGLGPWYNHRRARAQASVSRWTIGNQPSSFSVDTSSILFVLSGAFVGIEDVIRQRLTPSPPNPSSTSATPATPNDPTNPATSWTSTDLLSQLEPADLESYGMIPEFIGRVPVSVVLNPLTRDDLIRVMTEPRNSLVDQYTSLFALNGIELHISRGAVEEVVLRAIGTTSSSSAAGAAGGGGGGGGARSLRRIMEDTLLDAFYESYGTSSVKYILVDRESVKEGKGVKLFSRGQKYDFEERCRIEMEQSEDGKDKRGKEREGRGGWELDAQRTTRARAKARALIRSRLRRTNRLVDPVIYV